MGSALQFEIYALPALLELSRNPSIGKGEGLHTYLTGLGASDEEAFRVKDLLVEDELIDGIQPGNSRVLLRSKITAKGLKLIGSWPSDAGTMQLLVEQVASSLDSIADQHDDESSVSKLHQAASILREFTVQVAATTATQLAFR